MFFLLHTKFINFCPGLIKPFVMSGLLNKIHFHSSNMDYEKFYEECIPKSHLPSDFGGDLGSVKELHDKHRKDLMELRDYFMMEENYLNKEYEKYVDENGNDTKL